MIDYPESKSIGSSVYLGTWKGTKVPIYNAMHANDLNQIVGYVKHKNAANGTVLYRGQCELYPSILPSIKHNPAMFYEDNNTLSATLNAMAEDSDMMHFFDCDKGEISGWNRYQKLICEAVLQHYGGHTFAVDFVDNHWTALWFGLYKWFEDESKYKKRVNSTTTDEYKYINKTIILPTLNPIPDEPPMYTESDIPKQKMAYFNKLSKKSGKSLGCFISAEINRRNAAIKNEWETACKNVQLHNKSVSDKIKAFKIDDTQAHMFLFLYVAETNAPCVAGLYLGNTTYTIDLRKALPSTFMRPCSQHGWIVRGKDDSYNFDANIACIIRVNVALVDKLLGNGLLVTPSNFFPSYEFDVGYHVLLERQIDSGISSKRKKLFQKTHYQKLISDISESDIDFIFSKLSY